MAGHYAQIGTTQYAEFNVFMILHSLLSIHTLPALAHKY